MKLIIVSGRSGSGKSTALHVLEDVGFYCIDNLPLGLLVPLTEQVTAQSAIGPASAPRARQKVAVSIDARTLCHDIARFEDVYQQLRSRGIELEVLYLDAQSTTLLKRFHATRRKHPLSSDQCSLAEAIEAESALLEPLASVADLKLDTTDLGMYQLRDLIKERVAGHRYQELAVLFQSFGFKNGIPHDADFIFDVRCLPNPYWDTSLRQFNGTQAPVINFLENHAESGKMVADIAQFMNQWLPSFQASNRTYMTIGIGCTGGQHRSVYVCEKLGALFRSSLANVQIRHRELPAKIPPGQEH